MTHFPKLFNSNIKMTNEQLIIIANDDSVPIFKSGNITVEWSIVLKDGCLHVPQLTNNLISTQTVWIVQ